MKALTQSEDMIRTALQKSTAVVIVDDRIKSTSKSGRSTIILREIPSTVPESEVRTIFDYETCKPVVSIRSDVEDTWYGLYLFSVCVIV